MAIGFVRCFLSFKNYLIVSGVKRLATISSSSLRQKITGDSSSESSSSSESDSNHERFDESEEEIKQKILGASLEYVHELGWTFKALAAGAETVGLPSIAHGMFPGGGVELIHFFYRLCNTELVEKMKADVLEKEIESNQKRPNEFIRNAIETRLRMIIPYIEVWPQALGLMALPPNSPEALRNLVQLVDDICFYAGDKSSDLKWYSKRFSLAAVYKSTELCLIQDESEDFIETWNFLNRRITQSNNVSRTVQQVQDAGSVFQNSFSGLIITAQNMIGMNNRIR